MKSAFFAAIACASLACVTSAASAASTDMTAIQALDDQFAAAANRGDGAAVAALYAPDATILPPDNSVVSGAGIKTLLAGMAAQITDLKLTATDVKRISPDYIREIGAVTFTTKGDKPTTVHASYVVVWRKVDGAWKLWTDIFH